MKTLITQLKKQLKISDSAFIGLFLYGSQNYGLDTDTSDSDYFCIVTEFNLSYTTVRIDTHQIKVYSLYYFLDLLRHGDLESLECLYTEHSEVNPYYQKALKWLVTNSAAVLDYNNIKASLKRKLAEHLSYLHIRKVSDSAEARYSRKRLYWAIRVADQLDRIIAGESFEKSLIYSEANREELLKIKTIENYLDDTQVQKIEENLKTLLASLNFSEEPGLLIPTKMILEAVARFKELEHLSRFRNN